MHTASGQGDGERRMKLHDDEVDIDTDVVRRLVAEQFPHLIDLPVTEFTTGTVNAI